jgi:hypothetical protein
MSKFVCILLLIASSLALASCVHDSTDVPDDCIHRTFGCDMNGHPL